MPLKLNVGLNRKLGEPNYGSRGASVNLELELDSGLIEEPARLKERIRQLYGLVRTALAEELNGGNGNGHPASSGDARPPGAQNGNGNRENGAQRASGQRNGGQRQATQSQVRALHAIARSRQVDLTQFLQDRYEVARPDDLSIKLASQAIDELKGPDGQGG
jgi:hypothetical protein